LEEKSRLGSVMPEVDLKHYLAVLGKWKWIIVGITAVAVVSAGLLSKFMLPKVYESTAEVMVSASNGQQPQVINQNGLAEVLGNLSGLPQPTVDTYAGEMTGNAILSQVAKQVPAPPGGLPYTSAQLRRMVKVTVVPGNNQQNTNLIQVQASNTDPKRAALIANTVVADFIQFISQQNKSQMSGSVSFLQAQAKVIGGKLAAANQQLSVLQASSDVTQLQSELAAKDKSLSGLEDSLQGAQVSLAEQQAAVTYLQQKLASLSADHSAASQSLQATVQQDLVGAQSQAAQSQAEVSVLGSQVGATKTDIAGLQQQLAAANLKQQDLQNEITILGGTYHTLKGKETDAQVAEAANLGDATVSVVSKALPPTSPSEPKSSRNVAVAGMLGLLVSVALVFLLEYLDSTVKTPEDVERLVGLSTLGVIPHHQG
jgi:capsular polysaccharide biosynthesis protein